MTRPSRASIHFAKLDIEIHDLPPDSHDMAFNNDRTADSAHNSSIEPVHPSSIGTISLVSPDFVAAARADPERFACMYASIKAHVDQITLEIQEATATIRELGKEVQRQESRIERLRQEIQGKDEIIKHLYAHLQRDAFQNAHQNLGGAPQAGAPATANDLQRDRGEATEDAQQLGLRARCNTLETLEEVDEASDSARDEQKADELDP